MVVLKRLCRIIFPREESHEFSSKNASFGLSRVNEFLDACRNKDEVV
jgi:hypothetical protein